MPPELDLTALLARAETDPAARDQVFTVLYDELRRVADRQLHRGGMGLTLGSTTLVHEVWLAMSGRETSFADRARFLGYAARAMRGLIVDYARRGHALKRGRRLEVTLDEQDPAAPAVQEASAELAALDEALGALGAMDPRLAELVDLHHFAGFTLAEIAELRGVAERTVQRDWRKARMVLHRSMHGDAPGGTP